ncbi:MAG: hypothetical protein ACRDD1_09755 [Planctomycetia bacterium]
MVEEVELLRDDPALRSLLAEYRRRRTAEPKAGWYDRVDPEGGATDADWHRLHGVLIANGWLDVRVHAAAFAEVGKVAGVYAVTADGVQALRFCENAYAAEEVWDAA